MNLVPVGAYYLDGKGNTVPASPLNALMAEDLAAAWEGWRSEAKTAKGWELLLSPPAAGAGDYTRAMFRTPEDQQALTQTAGATAADLDSSAHQAGRAVDLDLAGMAAKWPDFKYSDLVAMAERHGFTNRVYKANGSEPWHFDDNPVERGFFASMREAVEAIGNTAAQVAADLAAGRLPPQLAALQAAATSPAGLFVLAVLAGVGAWLFGRRKGKK